MLRQHTISTITKKLPYLSDKMLEGLLKIVESTEAKSPEQPQPLENAPKTIDGDPYITYGKDETEHLLASVANTKRLNKSIKDENAKVMTTQEFETLVNEHTS